MVCASGSSSRLRAAKKSSCLTSSAKPLFLTLPLGFPTPTMFRANHAAITAITAGARGVRPMPNRVRDLEQLEEQDSDERQRKRGTLAMAALAILLLAFAIGMVVGKAV